MADLRENLMSYMRSMGATEIFESTKKHFRRKLEREFGDLLQFEDLLNDNKMFVLPESLSKGQLAREMVELSQQLENSNYPSKIKKIQQAGLYVRVQFVQILLKCHGHRNLLSYVRVQSIFQQN